ATSGCLPDVVPAPASVPTAALSLHDALPIFHCRLGGRHILRGLDAQPLRVGTVVAIVGPNGAGKSTLLRCIAGFVPCEAERMEVHGKDLRRLKPSERSACLRYLPQAAPAPLNLSVQECLDVAL